jgi:GNAT superfamily N-acetyltransferase
VNGPRQFVRHGTSRNYQFQIIDHPYEDPDSVRLMEALDAELARIYGSGDREPVEPDSYTSPDGLFLVGYDDGVPVACGAMRLRTDIKKGKLDAEIKRMYVEPGFRRQGWGAAVLAELLNVANEAGAQRAVLETGSKSQEALALYLNSGFVHISPYSTVYANSPTNRGMARYLAPHTTS